MRKLPVASLITNTDRTATALEVVEKQGIAVNTNYTTKPPVVPADITILDDSELMELFGYLTAQMNFASTQLAIAQVDEKELENELEIMESKGHIAFVSQYPKATMATIKAFIATDEDVVLLRENIAQKYAYRKMVEAMTNNVERSIQLVSREVTRRASQSGLTKQTQKYLG
jgi:hypothetical protein